MIPFIKIGETHFYENNEQFNDDDLFITNQYHDEYFNKSNIIYIPCILQDEMIKNHLKNYEFLYRYTDAVAKFKHHLNSLSECKLSISVFNKFISKDIINDFLIENFESYRFIHENTLPPLDYEYLVYAYKCAEYMSKHFLKYNGRLVRVAYSPFMPFGRYGLKNESFNILSLDKSLRHNLVPANEGYKFLEFDFNAFEIRTLLAVSKIKQPEGDLYDLLHKSLNDNSTRDQFKKNLIVSLYSGKERETVLKPILDSRQFYKRYPIIDGNVVNIFGKKMQTDSYHLLSRVLQSSAAYILFKQMHSLISFIKEKSLKSRLAFCIHDSVCLEIHESELNYINDFKNIITNVSIEHLNYKEVFPVKTKIGENYGNLKQIET